MAYQILYTSDKYDVHKVDRYLKNIMLFNLYYGILKNCINNCKEVYDMKSNLLCRSCVVKVEFQKHDNYVKNLYGFKKVHP